MPNNSSFLGTGWSFPPTFGRGGADVQTVPGAEDIEQSLAILFETRRGERVMQDDFGCDLSEFLFGEISQGLIGRVRSVMADAILHHEPRITLNEVEVSESGSHGRAAAHQDRLHHTRHQLALQHGLSLLSAGGDRPGRLIRIMADFILMEGDQVIFMPAFTPAIVVVQPGKLEGSGPATIGGKKICVVGDESKVAVAGCTYMTPQYSIPGTGTLKISALAGNQKATKTQTGGKKVMLKGGNFTAAFEVESPAQQPPPGPGSPIPDAKPKYSGNGMFVTTNAKFSGT